MISLRALGYAVLVAAVVFYYLAVPILRDLFGPAAVLPAYAAVALLAGAATYHVVRFLSARGETSDGEPASSGEPASIGADETEDGENAGPTDREVDNMLGELEADREG